MYVTSENHNLDFETAYNSSMILNNHRQINRWIIILLVVLVLAAHIPVVAAPANSLVNWYSTDDAFYYFKIAQNVAEGYGFTFDRLGADSGFHPLWLFICIPFFALANVDRILPLRLLIGFLALLNAGSAVLLYLLLKRLLNEWVSAFMALVWAFTPIIHAITTRNGMESGLVVFLLLVLLNLTARYEELPAAQKTPTRLVWIGFTAALLAMARLDNIFLIGLLGIWLLFRTPRVRILLMLDALAIALSVFLAYYFRLAPGLEYIQNSSSLYYFLAAALLVRVSAAYLSGLYTTPRTFSWVSTTIRILAAALVGSVVVTVFIFAGQILNFYPGFPRSVIVVEGGFALIWYLSSRLLIRWLDRSPAEPVPTFRTRVKLQVRPLVTSAAAYFLPVAGIMVSYMLWMKRTFDTYSPVSGLIKRWWGTLPNTVYGRPVDSLAGVLGWKESGFGAWSLLLDPIRKIVDFVTSNWGARWLTPASIFLTAVLIVFVVVLVTRNKSLVANALMTFALPVLFAASWIHLFSYTATSYVHMRSWYWLTQMVLLVLLGGILLQSLVNLLNRSKWLRFPFAFLLCISAIAILARFESQLLRLVPLKVAAADSENYLTTIRKLEDLTPAGARIGATGGGVTAYFISDRTIINMDGLMNTTAYFTALKTGHGRDYLDSIGLEYVFANPYVVQNSDPYFQLLEDRLVLVQDIPGWEPGTLFRYILP